MKTPAPKSNTYDALQALNQDFERVLSDLSRLEPSGIRRDLLQHFRVVVEETRAWANFEVAEMLHETELKDWSRYGRLRRRWEKRVEDPSDVLIEAEGMKDRQQLKVRRLKPTRKPATTGQGRSRPPRKG